MVALLAFGVLLLVASFAVDAEDGAPPPVRLGPLVTVGLVSGLAAFGLGGATVLRHSDAEASTAVVVGLVLAALVGAAAVRLARRLLPEEPPAAPAVGDFATVVTGIPAGGAGAVVLQRGRRDALAARSSSPVPPGTTVHVVEVTGPRSLVVEAIGV